MFDLTEVQENGGSGKDGLYVYPGVLKVKIKGWSHGTNQNGKPFISLKLNTLASEEKGEENVKEFKDFYMTPEGSKVHMPRIKHIVTKVTKEDNIRKVSNLDELVAMLNEITKGKSFRGLFHGREYELNGEVKETAVLPLNNFAEAINEGAEYEVVSDEESQLSFSKDNPKQFEKLDIQPTQEDEVESDAMGLDDL